MNRKPILSIIIVNFKSLKYLLQCLKSLQNDINTYKTSEILVVLNNYTNKEITLLAKSFKEVRIIKVKDNIGFAKANNLAIHKSKGEFVLLLNPDTVVQKETIQTILMYLIKNKKAAIATCRVNLLSGELDDASHRGFPTPWNSFCYFIGLSRIFPNSLFFNGYHLGYQHMNEIHEIDSCVGAFMMIRRIVGEEVEWFDEDYFWYGEDIDFCFKVKKRGWKIYYIPNVSILHYKGISSGIKRHSQELSFASKKTKLQATKARFEVMRIFYKKHYYQHYSLFIRYIVMLGIDMLEFLKSIHFKLKYENRY